jgi:hypothetical protein
MTTPPISQSQQKWDPYFSIGFKNDNNKLENLFKLAEAGEWEKLFEEISLDPTLVNATVSDGPNAGKTILWIATLQFTENFGDDKGNQAYDFINKLMKEKIPLNANATPLTGPLCGANIVWLLAKLITTQMDLADILRFDDPAYWAIAIGVIAENAIELINSYIKYPDLNINAAPTEGDFQGVTAFSLLLGYKGNLLILALKHDFVILDSASPPFQIGLKDRCNVIYALCKRIECNHKLILDLLKHYKHGIKSSDDQIFYTSLQSNCYLQMMNIIKNNPYCNINSSPWQFDDFTPFQTRPKNALEIIISLPSSPDRDRLLLGLIFIEAKLTDTAQADWKEEYDLILQKLNTVSQKAFLVCGYDALQTLYELRLEIALNLILSEFPDLQNFSPRFLLEKFARGFS